MFSFQQLNVTFIQEMGYIAVDIPHFILVLFSLFVCSIQALTIYGIVQIVMVLGSTYFNKDRISNGMCSLKEFNASAYTTHKGNGPMFPVVLHVYREN